MSVFVKVCQRSIRILRALFSLGRCKEEHTKKKEQNCDSPDRTLFHLSISLSCSLIEAVPLSFFLLIFPVIVILFSLFTHSLCRPISRLLLYLPRSWELRCMGCCASMSLVPENMSDQSVVVQRWVIGWSGFVRLGEWLAWRRYKGKGMILVLPYPLIDSKYSRNVVVVCVANIPLLPALQIQIILSAYSSCLVSPSPLYSALFFFVSNEGVVGLSQFVPRLPLLNHLPSFLFPWSVDSFLLLMLFSRTPYSSGDLCSATRPNQPSQAVSQFHAVMLCWCCFPDRDRGEDLRS